MKNIYSLKNIKHAYGGRTTLDVGELGIPEGGVIGLIGPNGGGKSTLLKVLAFLRPYISGELLFDGSPSRGRERELRGDVTLLLQEPYLLRRSVYDNIAYALKLRDVPKSETTRRVNDALARVGLDVSFAARPWFRLSGGEAQRVSLAVRLAMRPRVLLLDEPTANVDEASAALIKDAIRAERSSGGTTIIVATHDLPWLYETATQIIGMYGGRITGDGAANMIHGGWTADGASACLTTRAGKITAALPDGRAAAKLDCASLSPSDITLKKDNAEPDGLNKANVLRGVVTQISLERSTGELLCVADCNGLFLRARVNIKDAPNENIYPGQEIRAIFPHDALKFV
ncbi:hypothetical protein FACS1894167_08540 [Synergistales bacterium]|nr:hypothetical protein FACS1894167_08540 [Synergistales bacterium]